MKMLFAIVFVLVFWVSFVGRGTCAEAVEEGKDVQTYYIKDADGIRKSSHEEILAIKANQGEDAPSIHSWWILIFDEGQNPLTDVPREGIDGPEAGLVRSWLTKKTKHEIGLFPKENTDMRKKVARQWSNTLGIIAVLELPLVTNDKGEFVAAAEEAYKKDLPGVVFDHATRREMLPNAPQKAARVIEGVQADIITAITLGLRSSPKEEKKN